MRAFLIILSVQSARLTSFCSLFCLAEAAGMC